MILTLDNLETGINWWLVTVPKWGGDIMNSEYAEIYNQRSVGINEQWWQNLVDRLWNWKAIRGPKPPNTKEQIFQNGLSQLDRVSQNYSTIRSLTQSEPSISDVSWEMIQELFSICHAIKWGDRRNASPVFGCKTCHFLFPMIFPVIDNYATGVFEYEFYWRGMKDEWQRFLHKDEARRLLESAMKPTEPHPLYPWTTKVIELCHIGYYQGKV